VKRFDQTEKPLYPNFEQTCKDKVVGNLGWGVKGRNLKYKTAYSQKGASLDRWHLKYLDHKFPSNFAGHPAGFNERKPDRVLLDMSPE